MQILSVPILLLAMLMFAGCGDSLADKFCERFSHQKLNHLSSREPTTQQIKSATAICKQYLLPCSQEELGKLYKCYFDTSDQDKKNACNNELLQTNQVSFKCWMGPIEAEIKIKLVTH